MRELVQRWLKRGPKYGVSRGVAVFGPPGFDAPQALKDSLGASPEFAGWASRRGVSLSGSPDSLLALEDRLDEWRDSEMGPALSNELGLYLGRVIVHHVPGADWVAWPNGHPVVRLASGRELDVLDVAETRLVTGVPALSTIYADASQR